MNICKQLLLSIFLCSVLQMAYSQKAAEPSVLALQFGPGIAGSIRVPGDTIIGESSNPNVSATVMRKPVIMVSYDYLITNRFSVGGLLGYQLIQVTSEDENGKFFESGNINRTYLGFRGMWHYGNNEKIDLYSGFKVGTIMFSTSAIEKAHPGESEIESQNNRSRLAVGFIPIGARFYINDLFGINLETSWGSPAFMCAGINYRF